MDVKAIFGRMDSANRGGSCFRQFAFGKSCHQPDSFSHRSLAHYAENRCLRFIKIAFTNLAFPYFGIIIELAILIEGDDDLLTKYIIKTAIN